MREGLGERRVLPRENSGDFWDRVVGYSMIFAAGAVSALLILDVIRIPG
jgi:hypothetical protein